MKKLILVVKLLLVVQFTFPQESNEYFLIPEKNTSGNRLFFHCSHIESNKYSRTGGPANLETFLNVHSDSLIVFHDYKKIYPHIFNIKDTIYCLTYEPAYYKEYPSYMERDFYLYKRIGVNNWEKEIKEPLTTHAHQIVDEYKYTTLFNFDYGNSSMEIWVNDKFNYDIFVFITQNYDKYPRKPNKDKQYNIMYGFIKTPNGVKLIHKERIDYYKYFFNDTYDIISKNEINFEIYSDKGDTIKYNYKIDPKTYEVHSTTIH